MIRQHLPRTQGLPSATLMPLSKVPDHLPGRDVRRVDVAVVHRWARLGRRGVKLRAVRVRGKMYTTRAWLLRFLNSGVLRDSV